MITEQRIRDEIQDLIEALIASNVEVIVLGYNGELEVDLEGVEQIKIAIRILRWVVQDGTEEATP